MVSRRVRKLIFFLMCGGLVSFARGGEDRMEAVRAYREWTNREGQSIEARIAHLDMDQARIRIIRKEDQKMFTLPLTTLSSEDVDWVLVHTEEIQKVSEEVKAEILAARREAREAREAEARRTAALSSAGSQSGPSPFDTGKPPFEIVGASILGGDRGESEVTATAIQSDGAILIGGPFGGSPVVKSAKPLGKGKRSSEGVVLRLTGDGRTILNGVRLGADILQIVVDGRDMVYVAAGEDGLYVLDPGAGRVVRHHDDLGYVIRVSASPGGFYAALVPDNTGRSVSKAGAGRMHVFDPQGRKLSDFRGHRHTLDLAVHEPSRTVIHTGWRQARSHQPDSNKRLPVQISYLRGVGFDGKEKWTGYDWSTNTSSERFLNASGNNMADSRGYRTTVGQDGKLYVAYEVAGGNHIFRRSPFDIMESVGGRIPGGPDKFHQMYNTKSEHKTFVGVYEPDTGEFLAGQEFVARLSSGRGNAWRVKGGEIGTSKDGLFMMAATSAAGVPFTFQPETSSDYRGGAVLHGMRDTFRDRVYGTFFPGGNGRSVSVRSVSGNQHPVIVFSGTINNPEDDEENFLLHYPLQSKRGKGSKSGFFVVMNGRGGQN